MKKNLTGRKFNGRSFYGKDLTGADFSDCELKSCDFRHANLRNAKFRRAKMGIYRPWILLKHFLSVLIGLLAGFLIAIASFTNYLFISEIFKFLDNGENISSIFAWTIFAMAGISTLISIRQKTWNMLLGYCITILVAGAVVGAVEGAGTIAIVGAAVVVVVIAIAVVGPGAGAGAVMGAAVGAAVAAATGAGVGIGMLIFMSAIFILLGWYLNRCALKHEEPMLAWLRRRTLFWQCWKGTQFSGALLSHTDFSDADLRHTRFSGAQFKHPVFQGAQNLRLAQTVNTPLQNNAHHINQTKK